METLHKEMIAECVLMASFSSVVVFFLLEFITPPPTCSLSCPPRSHLYSLKLFNNIEVYQRKK